MVGSINGLSSVANSAKNAIVEYVSPTASSKEIVKSLKKFSKATGQSLFGEKHAIAKTVTQASDKFVATQNLNYLLNMSAPSDLINEVLRDARRTKLDTYNVWNFLRQARAFKDSAMDFVMSCMVQKN